MLSSRYVSYENDHIGIILKNKCHDRHKHFCKHIIISETPIFFKFDDNNFMSDGVFIQSEIYHDVDYTDTKVLVVAIEETSLFAKCIDYLFLKNCQYCEIPDYIKKDCIRYLENNDLKSIKKVFRNFIINANIIDEVENSLFKDERIEKALDIINESESLESDMLYKILMVVGLSKSRFSHLFKECIGVSFKRYILLKRIEKTFWYSLNYNMSITDAAINAGFSSSSHFAYAFKKNYGISYSKFLSTR